MTLHHRLLHGMQAAVRLLQILDRQQCAAIEGGQEPDAGIDRLEGQLTALKLAHDHGAGAAIALGAAFLGAGAMQVFAQMLQHGARRRHAFHAVDRAAVVELDRLSHWKPGWADAVGRKSGV